MNTTWREGSEYLHSLAVADAIIRRWWIQWLAREALRQVNRIEGRR